ncbi:uncharacterized protein LOC129588317 [Paramacrobiotus metropolitanus]|uniref:uncharacterized protein LOC129588317 n=1 Tax=Paramacrobiotus metropolitanus TaxID=2943436 RepID=UPI0024461B6F|nr:uncharacterized protein LOC129588317 [Paramacrobiotus metropolitanus]XP_055338457.1 uncharacterized protein LOC129588317 [Paramacrobiotus metropolitanus]
MDADGSSSETLDSCEDQRKKNAYCSTTNRLYLSLCHSIVWNVCEHYENKIREKQAAVAARFPGTPVTSSGADASIVRGGANVNGECAVPVHSETVEKAGIVTSAEPDVGEHQYEDFVGLLNDAFSKHEELRNDATDQKELSNWRANYVEQHGVLTGAMEINAQLCRDLIAAKNQNNTLKKQLVNDAQAVQCADAQQRQEHTPLSKPDSDANLLSAGGSNGHVEDCEKVELRKKSRCLRKRW